MCFLLALLTVECQKDYNVNMDSRKELILNILIKEHIGTGSPVGSSVLVEKYDLDISPATARNELASLENDDYIMQPHTSAGRVPTEKAYRWYLEKLSDIKINKKLAENIISVIKDAGEQEMKDTSKILSDISNNAVFCAFHKNSLYYTGISNLFQQPEFKELSLIYDISGVIDRMDEVIGEIFNSLDFGVHTLIGSDNPFGNFCSVIMSKHKSGENEGLLGILGPLRMDYQKNIALIRHINQILNN